MCVKINPLFKRKKPQDTAADCATYKGISIADYPAVREKFSSYMLESGENFTNNTINDCYFNQPLRESVILMVGLGKNVRGNLLYIINELNHSELWGKKPGQIYINI